MNAIEIAKCKDESQNSFCIKSHEKRLRDLDLGSSGGFQKHKKFDICGHGKLRTSFSTNQHLFENYDKYFVLFVKVARSILLELLLNILTMTPLRE